MSKLSENAMWVFRRLYLDEGETKPVQTFRRVTNAVIKVRPDLESYKDEFIRIQNENRFRVNTPCYMNLGCNRRQIASACFVGNLQDSMEEIKRFYDDATEVFLAGAGIGANFSDLRENKAPLTTGGSSSGPIAFIRHLNSLGGTIKSGGKTRRAAAMVVFDVSHPDVMDVIRLKTQEDLSNINVSINLTEDFLQCLQMDGIWETKGFKDGQVKTKIKARDIMTAIAESSHACGDPGVVFLDRINNWDTTPSLGPIRTTNPCVTGETLVAVADGRGCVSIQQLAEEEKDVLVHCCDPKTGKAHVRMGRKPRKTREQVPVLKVTLDDGSSIRTTYDHKFLLRSGEKIEAKDLQAGMSLMPFSRYQQKNGTKSYWKINNPKKQIGERNHFMEHQMILSYYEQPQEGKQRLSKDKKESAELSINFNHKVVSVEPDGVEDVYNITVDEFHTVAYVTNENAKTSKGLQPKHSGIISPQCGEQPLHAYQSCDLGSINIGAHIDGQKINWEDLEKTVRVAVRMLDGMLDAAEFPTDNFKRVSMQTRNIGLGIMGLADTLLMLNLPYDSSQAREFASQVMNFVTATAWSESIELAKEVGPFPLWEENKDRISSLWGIDEPVRNSQVTTIAPTGTVSISCECSSGMEPLFAIVYEKNITDTGDIMTFVHPEFERRYGREPWYDAQLINEIKRRGGTLQKVTKVPPEVKRLWKTAHDIHWMDRVLMQAELQKAVTSSISSTVNLPNGASVDDVYQLILFAYEQGLKGVTVYRDGSKTNQPITFGGAVPEVRRFKRPRKLQGNTICVKTALGHMYITINEHEGRPIECFVEIGKSGNNKKADAEALGRMVSLLFQMGCSVQQVYDQLVGIAGRDIAWDEGKKVLSIYDALARVLWDEYIDPQRETIAAEYDECPNCRHGRYIHKEGCSECIDCGFSKCG
jgi:ribonucleoside-diphosphate reductase alpha chain